MSFVEVGKEIIRSCFKEIVDDCVIDNGGIFVGVFVWDTEPGFKEEKHSKDQAF